MGNNTFIFIYAVFINIVSFMAMKIDKSKAKKHEYRISEKKLFLFVILGGSIGGIMGMYAFHHKTKHWYFRYGFPLILMLQVAAIMYISSNMC